MRRDQQFLSRNRQRVLSPPPIDNLSTSLPSSILKIICNLSTAERLKHPTGSAENQQTSSATSAWKRKILLEPPESRHQQSTSRRENSPLARGQFRANNNLCRTKKILEITRTVTQPSTNAKIESEWPAETPESQIATAGNRLLQSAWRPEKSPTAKQRKEIN